MQPEPRAGLCPCREDVMTSFIYIGWDRKTHVSWCGRGLIQNRPRKFARIRRLLGQNRA